jgi:predicted dehydrogenase
MHFLIIGVGSVGERHLRNALRLDDVRCSIAEVNPSTRQKIASAYRVEAAYGDYHDADLASFDGVVICVPADLHVPIATEVVKAGTHVLVEKPLAMSLQGVDELKRLRDEQEVVVLVGFTYRTDPLIQEIKSFVESSELGTVRVVNFYVGQYWPRMRKDYPPRYALKRETGGGAIPDHLVHTINWLEWVFGPPEEISANQWRLALDDLVTEDTGFMTMRFPGGQVAQLGICLFQRDTNQRLQMIADGGTLQLLAGSDALEIYVDGTSQWAQGRARAVDRDDLFRDQAQHFVDCIQGKAQPHCSIEEAEQTLRTVLAALESSDGDGRFVRVARS